MILFIFWSILIIILFAEVGAILYYINHPNAKTESTYSEKVIENMRIITSAISSKIIKKHILTDNTKEEYDFLLEYKNFLNSNLMNDITNIKEEQYYG